MICPRTPGAGITGADVSLGGERIPTIVHVGPCFQRLYQDLRLQRSIEHRHRCGPRPVGELLVEVLDSLNANPAVLDMLLGWEHIDADLVKALGGDRFPPHLQLVPL